jgi:hypothetical protein
MKKLIKFEDKQLDKIQRFANKQFEGNFSLSVRYLCEKGLKNEKSNTNTANTNRVRRE